MDKLEQYRKIIQTVVERHAQYIPSHGEIETLPLCDTLNDNYLSNYELSTRRKSLDFI